MSKTKNNNVKENCLCSNTITKNYMTWKEDIPDWMKKRCKRHIVSLEKILGINSTGKDSK